MNLFAFEESMKKLDNLTLSDRERDIIHSVSSLVDENEIQLSPLTNSLTYLIFKEGEKLNDLFILAYALIISVLGGKIDSLSETIYEVCLLTFYFIAQIERPHRCAAYVAQMLRLLLFGATLKENYDDQIAAIPELVGPLTDIIKKLKLSLQPELNAPCSMKGSALLVSVLHNLSYQYSSIMTRMVY